MTNIVKKFKDRDPKETVKIINNFFQNRGYKVKVMQTIESEAGTFSCALQLFKNNQKILHSSGKGTSLDFALASGHAELYERFCNKCNFIRHPFFVKNVANATYEKYGYYYHPDEVVLSYEDIMQYNVYNTFYTKLLHSKQNIEAFWKLVNNSDTIIGEPYYDLTNNKTVYHNLAIANRITTSGGLAAGNTIEEALNQGLSELCEHMVADKFLLNEQDKYYAINLKSLSPHLQTIINNIENAGFKFFVFDLSYNFDMPVMMSLLINPYTQNTRINFGAFPIFDIAVERVITEIYQGTQNFAIGTTIDISPQIPYLINDPSILNQRRNSMSEVKTFNEQILLNKMEIVESCNTKVFKTDIQISNKELLNYFIDLFKSFNYSIHYTDHGLCPDIKAVSIIIPEYDYSPGQFLQCLYHSEDKIYQNLLEVMRLHKLCDSIINNKDSSLTNYMRFIQIQSFEKELNNNNHDGDLIGALVFLDWINPIPIPECMIWLTLDLNMLEHSGSLYHTIFYKDLKKFVNIQNYVRTQQYTKDEIKQILALFNLEISDEDIDNCFNNEYLFQKIIVESVQNYYITKDYWEIVQSLVPDKMEHDINE